MYINHISVKVISISQIVRITCSLCLGDGCVRRTFDAENVVGMTSGLRERLLRYDSLCSAIRFIAALDVA